MKIEEKIEIYLEEIEVNEGLFDSLKSLQKKFDNFVKSDITDKLKKKIIKFSKDISSQIDKQATEMAFGKNKKKAQDLKTQFTILLGKVQSFMKENNISVA